MKKRCCSPESQPATASADAANCGDAPDESDIERAAAIMGHDAVIARAEGELAAALRRKVVRRR